MYCKQRILPLNRFPGEESFGTGLGQERRHRQRQNRGDSLCRAVLV